MQNQWKKNIETVSAAEQGLFTRHDFSVFDRYFSPGFVEHSPLVADAVPGLKKLVTDAGDVLRHDVVRIWADGDLVALHGSYTGLADFRYVGFDIYRLENRHIAEHWDGLVPEQPANVSGHTQLDGTAVFTDFDKTEANRSLVESFFRDVLMSGNYHHIPRYTDGDCFTQHSADIGDGATAMQSFLDKLRNEGNPLIYKKLYRTVACGNFVLTQSEGLFSGKRTSYCELWRVEDGKIAELWDAIGEIPEDNEALHGFGLY